MNVKVSIYGQDAETRRLVARKICHLFRLDSNPDGNDNGDEFTILLNDECALFLEPDAGHEETNLLNESTPKFEIVGSLFIINLDDLLSGKGLGLEFQKINLLQKNSCLLFGRSEPSKAVLESIINKFLPEKITQPLGQNMVQLSSEIADFLRITCPREYKALVSRGIWPSKLSCLHESWMQDSLNGRIKMLATLVSLVAPYTSGVGNDRVNQEWVRLVDEYVAEGTAKPGQLTVFIFGSDEDSLVYNSLATAIFQRWPYRYKNLTIKELPSSDIQRFRLAWIQVPSNKEFLIRLSASPALGVFNGIEKIGETLGNTEKVSILWIVPESWIHSEFNENIADAPLGVQLIEISEAVDALQRCNMPVPVIIHFIITYNHESDGIWPALDAANDNVAEATIARSVPQLYNQIRMTGVDTRFHWLPIDKKQWCLRISPVWIDLMVGDALGFSFTENKMYRSASREHIDMPEWY